MANRAGGLFIWAKTVIKFITRGEPGQELDLILTQRASPGSMGLLYSQILALSFPIPRKEVLDAFQSLLSAVIFVRIPLHPSALAQLLSIELHQVEYICDRLRSVIILGRTLQIRHQSFVDFLIDDAACPSPFVIRPGTEERRLSVACLGVV